jgi:predicted ATPase/DNA-binding SARP family transcriptional activator
MSGTFESETGLCMRFLGGCDISLPEGQPHLETAKTRALLVYLALNQGLVSRHTLMGLLWGELPEANARRNLRRALWNLRRQLSSPDRPPPILADRQMVCFNREVPYNSDVEAFEVACSHLDPALSTSPLAPHLDQARRAAALYQGEFLEGFYVANAVAFEEWALTERERLRAMALHVLRHLVAGYAAQNETETALHYAERLLVLEPWLEEAHGWLMRLLARSGRRAEALAQYEACKRVLAEELGVAPSQETRALYEQIRAGGFETSASNLPASTTPFVGRARELAELADLLADADCRLLTVTGLGGVGKTRLAREVAAQQVTAFAHGVHYVALDALSAPERIAAALARSLDIPLVGTADPRAALLAYLRKKEMLLVMDGFEHLLEGVPLLSEILQVAPGIKILVTSRERLNLRGEWVYILAGLSCAPAEHAGDLASFDAVQLFLQTARRVHLGFRVGEGADLHLARICNLVAGLPLAIELAAAWVRVLSLAEIAAEIAQHLDFLATAARDSPTRQRSIRAVFDHSWRLLSSKERDAFRKLSVFQGSFRRQEAIRVGGASLPILSALVDKSLLQRLPFGRYQLHELLRQYAREQLEQVPGEKETARDLHCQAYAAQLGRYKQALKDAAPMPILSLIGEDRENVDTAWRWALQQQNYEAIEAMHAALADYYHLTTSFREGEVLFREALEELGWLERNEAHSLLRCKLLSSQATFSVYLGRFSHARTNLEHCLAVFAQQGIQDEMAHCQFFLAEIARFVGEYTRAKELFEQSLAGYQQVDNRSAVGFCLNGLGIVSSARGELTEARLCLQRSLVAFAETGHEMGQAIASINLADLLIGLGDRSAARKILDEGYALCRNLGHRWGMAVCLRHLGDIARFEERNQDAKAAYQKSLAIVEDIGQQQSAAACLVKLGEVCTDLGEYTAARSHLTRAQSIAAELQDQTQMVEIAATLMALLAVEGNTARALELATLVECHVAGVPATRELAKQLAAKLGHQIPDKDLRRIQRGSSARTLEDVLVATLSSLES